MAATAMAGGSADTASICSTLYWATIPGAAGYPSGKDIVVRLESTLSGIDSSNFV